MDQTLAAANSMNYLLFRMVFKNDVNLQTEIMLDCMQDFLESFDETPSKTLEHLADLAEKELRDGEYVNLYYVHMSVSKMRCFLNEMFGIEENSPVAIYYESIIERLKQDKI